MFWNTVWKLLPHHASLMVESSVRKFWMWRKIFSWEILTRSPKCLKNWLNFVTDLQFKMLVRVLKKHGFIKWLFLSCYVRLKVKNKWSSWSEKGGALFEQNRISQRKFLRQNNSFQDLSVKMFLTKKGVKELTWDSS